MPLKTMSLEFPSEILDMLATTYQDSAGILKEAATLELYREGKLSSGKAGELLGMERFEFIRYAGMKGIPYIRMTQDELQEEVASLENRA